MSKAEYDSQIGPELLMLRLQAIREKDPAFRIRTIETDPVGPFAPQLEIHMSFPCYSADGLQQKTGTVNLSVFPHHFSVDVNTFRVAHAELTKTLEERIDFVVEQIDAERHWPRRTRLGANEL